MYGFFHKALTGWVISLPDGELLLQQIANILGADRCPDEFFQHYSDERTQQLVTACSQVTGVPIEECKLRAGEFTLHTLNINGYRPVLETLGNDFYTMICNLNSIHDNFQAAFPNMKSPSLQPERNSDGSISINYYSEREGLAPFMMGALRAAARELYDLDIEITHRTKRGKFSDHDVFVVFVDDQSALGFDRNVQTHTPKMGQGKLSATLTNDLFPWHFSFNREMKLTSLGKKLEQRLRRNCLGHFVQKYFDICRPIEMTWDFANMQMRNHVPFEFVTKNSQPLVNNCESKLHQNEQQHVNGVKLITSGLDDHETFQTTVARLPEPSKYTCPFSQQPLDFNYVPNYSTIPTIIINSDVAAEQPNSSHNSPQKKIGGPTKPSHGRRIMPVPPSQFSAKGSSDVITLDALSNAQLVANDTNKNLIAIDEISLEPHTNKYVQNRDPVCNHEPEEASNHQQALQFTQDKELDEDVGFEQNINSLGNANKFDLIDAEKERKVPAGVDEIEVISDETHHRQTPLYLHGELVYDSDSDVLMFVGIPKVSSIEEMELQNIELADFPIHSHGREVLFGALYQRISADNTTAIDERLAELDRSLNDIQETKDQVNKLLHSILPPAVASSLAAGTIPKAQRYDKVTVLFSDIAGFTNISSGIPSIEVMEMLHDLFIKFDTLAEHHGCYKVETIGDAYMVAAGCPEECEDHALRIAHLAIDMIRTASTVLSPLDGDPLQIRIGIHSGSLMAGVVGRARPRYCFFGDTVNVASRMESNGIPGTIQVTYRFVRALPNNHDLHIISRGEVAIKGKGSMRTFLVVGCKTDPGQPLLPEDNAVLATIPEAIAIAEIIKMKDSLNRRESMLPSSRPNTAPCFANTRTHLL